MKHLGNLRFAPQLSEVLRFTYLVSRAGQLIQRCFQTGNFLIQPFLLRDAARFQNSRSVGVADGVRYTHILIDPKSNITET